MSEESEKASAYDALAEFGQNIGLGPTKEKVRVYGEGGPGKYVVNSAPKPKSNVRTREQDEFMTVEKKARESKRQCRARVSLPSRDGKTLVSFECTEPTGHSVSDHTEYGRIRLRNNRVYSYYVVWSEIEKGEVWREESTEPPKPRKITEAENKRMYADVEEGDY